MLYWCIRSVIEIIRCDLDYIFWFEVDADEGLSTVLFLILIHIVDLLYSSLFDDLGATEAGVVGGVESTSLSLPYTYLNDS